jgi:exodeoxyribonuclease VII small subunit
MILKDRSAGPTGVNPMKRFVHPLGANRHSGGSMEEQKFEDAMKRLEHIIEGLERGDLSLEDSLKTFEEGMKLVSFCSGKLEEAEHKVTMLVKEREGGYVEKPFNNNLSGEA